MKKQILELNAREDFICLGSQCPRDCCHGWDKIEIDASTIERWGTTQDPEAKQLLKSFINTMDDGTSVMSKTKEKTCAALNDKKLCNIQLQFGHDYLSETCRNFPKLKFHNYFRSYNSASFSCPEIVDKVLFKTNNAPLFPISEVNEKNDHALTQQDGLLYALDIFLSDILEKSQYPVGIILFFVSDVFVKIISMSQTGDLTENNIKHLRENIDTYLTDILKAVKHDRLKPNPVTSGSFWKNVYKLCESRNVDKRFLDDSSANLVQAIKRCDDSFSGYGKVYAVIKKYKKKANKQIKQQYIPLLRKYIQVLFINKGFPLAPKHTLDLVLVDCMVNISVVQLLFWIEVNKNGKLTDDYIKDCIVEVDRKFVLHDGVIKGLEDNPQMIRIDKYCNSFLDIF